MIVRLARRGRKCRDRDDPSGIPPSGTNPWPCGGPGDPMHTLLRGAAHHLCDPYPTPNRNASENWASTPPVRKVASKKSVTLALFTSMLRSSIRVAR